VAASAAQLLGARAESGRSARPCPKGLTFTHIYRNQMKTLNLAHFANQVISVCHGLVGKSQP